MSRTSYLTVYSLASSLESFSWSDTSSTEFADAGFTSTFAPPARIAAPTNTDAVPTVNLRIENFSFLILGFLLFLKKIIIFFIVTTIYNLPIFQLNNNSFYYLLLFVICL